MDNPNNINDYNNGNNSGGPNGSNGNNNKNGNNGNGDKGRKNGQSVMVFILISLITLFIMTMFMNKMTSMSTKEITYSEFLTMVEEGKVESVQFDSYQLTITPVADKEKPYQSSVTYYCGLVSDYDLVPMLKEMDIEISRVIPDNTSTWIFNILSIVIINSLRLIVLEMLNIVHGEGLLLLIFEFL